jgi:hypothetical protein
MLLTGLSCVHSSLPKRVFGQPCLDSEIQRLDNLPEKQIVTTLDSQQIHLSDFDPAHPFSQLGCTLPYKFYHWNHEVLEVSSKALKRDVQHKVRAYYNLTSTCYPEKRDDGQVYGDVAEFYDENATFMGFAIYLGQGLYCPLPHSGYAGPGSIEVAVAD